MSACAVAFAVSCTRESRTGVRTLQRERELNRFFAEVEKRALRIAEISVRDRDEALDLVQETELSVEQIALRCGYASAPTLSRAFKAAHGVNISAFRQEPTR